MSPHSLKPSFVYVMMFLPLIYCCFFSFYHLIWNIFQLCIISCCVWILFNLSLFQWILVVFVAAVADCTRRYYFISSYVITLSGTFFSRSFSSSPSLAITAGFRKRRAVSPGRANLHKSFHSGYPLQTPLYNICLHLGVHRPSHLLFLCSPPPSTLCELNKSCH